MRDKGSKISVPSPALMCFVNASKTRISSANPFQVERNVKVNFKPGEYMRNDDVITFSDTGGLEETLFGSSWNF